MQLHFPLVISDNRGPLSKSTSPARKRMVTKEKSPIRTESQTNATTKHAIMCRWQEES